MDWRFLQTIHVTYFWKFDSIKDRLQFLSFFGCKPGILRAQLRRLIPRTLWDPNGRQALPKSFNAAACPRLDLNPELWLS